MTELRIRENVSLRPYCTLRAGGNADRFVEVRTVDELAAATELARVEHWPVFVLGWGSNVLPADEGVSGLVIYNNTSEIHIHPGGEVIADSGCAFQDVFLKTAQASLGGLEFAVGIPGSIGGALVSNAGAYRSNVSEFLVDLEIQEGGMRRWVSPEWMQFSYRDSLLRRPNPPACAILRVRLRLPKRDAHAIYNEARDYQRQRIGKQPPPASAGSFFKNVYDKDLAEILPGLPPKMREAGVVPAGYLIEAVGLKGFVHGGAALAPRHANFVINPRGARAQDIRDLVRIAKEKVMDEFGVELEEEVLYLGRWPESTDSWA